MQQILSFKKEVYSKYLLRQKKFHTLYALRNEGKKKKN